MHRNNRKGILMGAGLLGIGTVLGLSTGAQAAPRHDRNRSDVKEERRDVKEARKDVRDAQRDLRRADTPGERREAVQDYREAQRDLSREQQELRREQWRDNRNDNRNDNRWNNGRRPDWNRNDNRNNGRVFQRPGYVPAPRYNGTYRPGYNQGYNPGYNPGYNGGYNGAYNGSYNNGYNGAWGTQNVTIEGTVISDRPGRSFTLRSTNGQVWQVQVQGAEPASLNRGDVVRVFGPARGTSVLATGLRILQNY